MSRRALSPEVLTLVAERFRALGEPARLQILDALRGGELTVGELADRTTLSQQNVSRHLKILHSLGFVSRRRAGLFVHYAVASRRVYELCDVMCDRLQQESRDRRRLLAS